MQLRSALDRLHTGLDAAEKDRIVARVAPAQHGKVWKRLHIRGGAAVSQATKPEGYQEGVHQCVRHTRGQCISHVTLIPQVHYMDFIRSLESPQPLGGPGLGVGFPGVTPQRAAAAGTAPTFWNWQRHKKQVCRQKGCSNDTAWMMSFWYQP